MTDFSATNAKAQRATYIRSLIRQLTLIARLPSACACMVGAFAQAILEMDIASSCATVQSMQELQPLHLCEQLFLHHSIHEPLSLVSVDLQIVGQAPESKIYGTIWPFDECYTFAKREVELEVLFEVNRANISLSSRRLLVKVAWR